MSAPVFWTTLLGCMPSVRGLGRGGAWLGLAVGCVTGVAGCASVFESKVEPLCDSSGLNRRAQLWELTDPTDSEHPATQPVTTRPVTDEELLSPPYRLNVETIVRLVYAKSPLVSSSRESMIAAQHGLEEFKANLSRFEPFVRTTGDANSFPERRDSEGLKGEITGGVEKETFDGAVIRVEGGASGERVEFGVVEEDQEAVERGNGGVLRARIEVPFVGSRKRQERVISAAFQESSARGAVLRYLTNFRSYVLSALNYYAGTLVYLQYMRAYERKLDLLEALLNDPRLKEDDHLTIQTTAGDARVLRDEYATSYQTYLLSMMEYIGISPGEPYVLEEPPVSTTSRYYELTRTPQQREVLLTEAYENNPQFRVLADAIKDSELKVSQAILGKNDITAFAEGTQFAFGAETYDSRVDGWQMTGGVSFRRNDQRVLTASRKKAEAEIRKYQAQIEAERLSVQRQVAVQSANIRSYIESRPQILENIARAEQEFNERRDAYLDSESPSLTIDDVLRPLSSLTAAEVRLASNLYSDALSEISLLTGTGEVYRMVGMKIVDNGNGVELPDQE